MTWTLAIAALATVSIFSLVVGLLGGRGVAEKEYRGPLYDYLLANQRLRKLSVIQLLFSNSFSLNGMLYQIWLGYSIGLWGLLIQGVWALSYILLARHTEQVRETTSLHAFLGGRFGERTRLLAGLCSVVGFTILIGWEFNVGKSTFAGILPPSFAQDSSQSLALIFMGATVLVSLLYTATGGLRSNAYANAMQNVVKALVFILMIVLAYGVGTTKARLLPSFATVITNLGFFGLVTNLAFSLFWQFVDMSTWHSVIASRQSLDIPSARSTLRWSGLAVFFAPGILGTVLGILLAGTYTSGVDSDNVMTKLISLLPSDNPVIFFLVFAALLATIMSMVDSLLLTAAYALMSDVFYRKESLEQIDRDENRAFKLLPVIRLFLFLIGVIGTLGVVGLTDGWGIPLFNIVYIAIICQMALTGPVLFGLWGNSAPRNRMSWAIITGLFVGIGAFAASLVTGWGWLATGAGVFAMIASCGIAKIVLVTTNTQEAYV